MNEEANPIEAEVVPENQTKNELTQNSSNSDGNSYNADQIEWIQRLIYLGN